MAEAAGTERCGLAACKQWFISQSSGAWTPEMRGPAGSGSGESPLLGFQVGFSHGREGERALGSLFDQGAHPIHDSSLEAPPANTITGWG